MKLERKYKRLIVLCIGLFFVVAGILEGAFHININREIFDEISFILLLVAAALLLSGRNQKNKAQNHETPEKNDSEKENQQDKE